MTEEIRQLKSQLEKNKREFEIATSWCGQAVYLLHKHIERLEKWMLENLNETKIL